MPVPVFQRYVGIDYSGAETTTSRLTGLAVFMARPGQTPVEVPVPAPPPARRWCRSEIANWLCTRLDEAIPTLVGIDHGFSFPLAYFARHGLPHNWPAFLDDFQAHWPTDMPNVYVDFIRQGQVGNGAARTGQNTWRRITELRARAAKSVFHFDVNGSVAKSTHTGIPWLRFLRRQCTRPPHFWPFDGWQLPAGKSAVVEVYPRVWQHLPAPAGLNSHQRDAWRVAEAMRQADANGRLAQWCSPTLTNEERTAANIEGWILGVA